MADTTPSPISPWRALYLCVLLIVAPEKFNAAEARDNEWRAKTPSNAANEPVRISVCKALSSLPA
jgi:hypothetical protein